MNNEYFSSYEEKLTAVLLDQCTGRGFLAGQLFTVEELEEKWTLLAPEYMADAVPNINGYPTVAIAWACYVGMGAAAMWDGTWDEVKDVESIYQLMQQPRGFDAMDEYIVEELLGIELDSTESEIIEELMRTCSHTALTMIRREELDPSSQEAFHLFASTVKVFFKLGVSLELKRQGYKYEKVIVDQPALN